MNLRKTIAPGLALLVALALPLVTNNAFYIDVLISIMVWSIAAYGLNMMLGYVGQLPLAHAGFFGIGAYAVGILTLKAGLSFWLALPIAIALCAALGFLLGIVAFRTRGDYFAIFTLAVGVIIMLIINKWDAVTGGNEGLNGVQRPMLFGINFRDGENFYYLVLAALVLTIYIAWRVSTSLIGRSFISIRSSEELAAATGINVWWHKQVGFMLSTGLAGLAGGVYAVYIGFLGAAVAGPITTFTLLLYVLIGGVATLWGPVVGTFLMIVLSQSLQDLQELKFVLYGPLLVLLVMFMPQGLAGLVQGWQARRPQKGGAKKKPQEAS